MIILFMYLQIIVGFTNIAGALIRIVIPYERNKTYKRDLGRYLILVLSYGLLYYLIGLLFEGTISEWLALGYVFVLPWCLAIYYWSIIFSPKNSTHVEES